MREAFIVDAIRTPIGKYGGALSSIRADDLAAIPIRALIERYPSLPPDEIEDVILGCANQAGEDNRNVARMAALLSGLPPSVPGLTVNRLCASGMVAVVQAASAIKLGEGEVFIAGGLEQMSRAPFVMPKPEKPFERNMQIFDTTLGWRFVNPEFLKTWGIDSMGETAENLLELYPVSRQDQDSFALWSQEKTQRAKKTGRLSREIIPVTIEQKKGALTVQDDEFPRADTTLDGLSALSPAFRKERGSVTAGNSSGINDGACSLLLASEAAVKRYKFEPKARVLSSAVAGVEPRIMGLGPVPATKKVLERQKLSLSQVSIIEINEAFAAQCLVCLRQLGLSDRDLRINPNGGAIALGHPLGMSGARLMGTAAYELIERKEQYALCTMCVGVGQGAAVILERV